ncbi:MAG: rane dipeptidase [Sphaerochaeta sp.]|jgi:membrane dipeptidase|uniref:Membrane dipeptidase n=1 Tax=Sphaerochaeta halotolerans TaxID=2293840 RepID=A0A372MJE5_9SPIR|nr:rane dipeptidase [Sphaerochaeta sp.]RFU95864.1 hypothetical protein DYP60_02340 [Sphaerochaeta halotolerans]
MVSFPLGATDCTPQEIVCGLKPFCYDVITEMERHTILVDVSHLNDEGFYDMAKVAGRPFIGSLSNCR